MNKALFFLFVLFLTSQGMAQRISTTTIDTAKSPVSTISDEHYRAYQNGSDIDQMGYVAKVNHYPDPYKVLQLKRELLLNADQKSKIALIATELTRKSKEMGAYIIKNEIALDKLMKSPRVDDGTLIFYSQRTDLYKGEWRNAILQAYVKVKATLSAGQIKMYEDLVKQQQ